ncbi:ABC transporter substrate-binding protein [Microbacterium sp. NPDC096154]|uniref:ABC transporter substrate-binding protein n=1 Tax=Microbacterium sp. NPDC096154 TaxID=3155549 RepID=UPI003333C03E
MPRAPLRPFPAPRGLTLLAGAGCALALIGCAPGGTSAPAADGADAVTVLYAPIAYEPLFIAEQEGFFEDAGLEVEIKRGGPPQDNLAQAIGGSADIITAAWDTMTTSTSEGVPVRVIAGNSVVSDTVDTSGLIVRADSGIDELADLQGRTIAFDSLGAGGSAEVYAALADAGIGKDEVRPVAVPYAGMAAALEAGQVDAVFPSEPFYTPLATDAADRVIANPVRETRAGAPITLWAASTPWLEANGDTAARFLEAMDRAIAFYEDEANLDAVKAIRAEVSQTPLAEVSDTLVPMRLAIDTDAVSTAVDQLVDFGTVDRAVPVEDILWRDAPTH